jgi:hypothetical protein
MCFLYKIEGYEGCYCRECVNEIQSEKGGADNAEYIDKADLVKRLESRVKDYGRDCNSNAPIISRTYQAVLHMVENLPTADVVEVVRCKDCEYFEVDEEDELGECKCGYITVSYNGALYPHRTDFCSYGERKCDNENPN